MKKKYIFILIVVMLVSLFNNMPALAADSGSGVVKFSGPANVVPGQTYTYIYKFIVRGAACGNANIVVGGAFEKVSGGENLFYDTIPNNTDGEISATITVRVKPDAAIGSTGTISVNEDESKCSKLVRDDSGNLDQVITNVTGKITATVVPATPSTPKVSSTGDGLLVQWNAVSGASGYEVWRRTGSSGSFVGISYAYTNSFLDTNVEFGKTYYYSIRAFNNSTGKMIHSDYSGYGSAEMRLLTPSKPTVSPTSNGLRIEWNSVPKASGYEVWRSTSRSGPFTGISYAYTNSYTDKSVVLGTTYYYSIRAFNNASGKMIFSEYSEYGSAELDTPSTPTVSSTNNGMLIQWNAVAGANKYEVWRSTSRSGPFVGISYADTTSFVDKNVTPGVTYYYSIRALNNANGFPIYGGYSDYGSGKY